MRKDGARLLSRAHEPERNGEIFKQPAARQPRAIYPVIDYAAVFCQLLFRALLSADVVDLIIAFKKRQEREQRYHVARRTASRQYDFFSHTDNYSHKLRIIHARRIGCLHNYA